MFMDYDISLDALGNAHIKCEPMAIWKNKVLIIRSVCGLNDTNSLLFRMIDRMRFPFVPTKLQIETLLGF